MATKSEKEPSIKEQIVEKMSSLITSAFGLVAALAWNDTIKSIFANYYHQKEGILARLIYATIVTIIAVVAAVWIGAVAGKLQDKKKQAAQQEAAQQAATPKQPS